MSKTAGRKLHWHSKVKEGFVPLVGSSADLGVAIGGGADYAEFPFVTSAPGGGLSVGDVILEIGGTPVLGMTLGDVRGVLSSCPHPVRIKTVSPGSSLCKDLRLYLSKCFTPGSVDSQLQQVIRENLYLRAVPCTSRKPRIGEISGVDYNFVSVEEFFALEESGALLESGKFKGNYYGTPRPVHISPESPPITYQEHRNLLKKFRTRSKSLSNLEKAAEEEEAEEVDIAEGDSALPGVRNTAPTMHHSPGRPRGLSAGEGGALDGLEGLEGFSRAGGGARSRAGVADRWEQAFSDPGQSCYAAHNPRRTSWQSMRGMSRETLYKNELLGFTDEPEDLRGFPVHTCIFKGPRGFGFNIVGGTGPHEFLQVYSVTADGPSALKTADILVYVGDTCVLGVSHREVVEILKAVPAGHSVDVEVRRGYPMLYNPDGIPKPLHRTTSSSRDTMQSPTTTQPQSLHHHRRPRLSSASSLTRHSQFDGYSRSYGYGERSYMEPGELRGGLDANGNATAATASSRMPPPYRRSSASNADSSVPVRPPRSLRSLARLQSLDQNLASQSDSEVVSAIGSHRASMIRNYNNNSLSQPPRPSRYKSSESDLSASELPGSRLPVPHSERRHSASPGGARDPRSPHRGPQSYAHLLPQGSHLRPPPPTQDGPHRGHNGHRSASPTSVSSFPGVTRLGNGGEGWAAGGGELVPVALGRSDGDQGLGFSVTAGGWAGEVTVVKRVWDRRQCSSLQPGDAIVKINGADVQSLSFAQVQRVLLEHTKLGEVVLLVYRGGRYPSSVSPNSPRRLPPPLLRPPPPPGGSLSDEVFTSPPEVLLPRPRSALSNPPASPGRSRSALVQSTSFLESIPVTLTMEPRDWMNTGLEDGGDEGVAPAPGPGSGQGKQGAGERPRAHRGFDVELKRKAGEGFGFVIASQDVENGKAASLLPHRFVTVRRGSPAARSGQIRQGDRLEAVEGRSVVSLPHRELSQILRRAGNTLRLTVVPRPSTYTSSLTETAEYDPSHRSGKGHRSRPKHDSRYYSVDLDRGPTGFGFSLRGGSEYNMGLYVLGLMEGGPASRSHKIQVSDQLVEINGDSTAGITHSQAVEHIRRGGQRIHLVLKRGNGYVPDYGREHRPTPPPLAPQLRQQSVAAVATVSQRGRSSKDKSSARSSSGRRERKESKKKKKTKGEDGGERGRERSRRRRHKSEGEAGSGGESPDSEPGGGRRREEEEAEEEQEEGGQAKPRKKASKASGSRRKRKSGRRSQSLPRDALRRHGEDDDDDDDGDDGGETVRGRRRRERRRSTSPGTAVQSRGRSREARERPAEGQAEEEAEVHEEARVEGVEEQPQEPTTDAAPPIPLLNQRLPQPKPTGDRIHGDTSWEEQSEAGGNRAGEPEAGWEADPVKLPLVTRAESERGSPPGPARPLARRRPFTFLTSALDLSEGRGGLDSAESWDGGSDSGASETDDSASTASVSGLSLAPGAGLTPGPWLTPSRSRLARVMEDH